MNRNVVIALVAGLVAGLAVGYSVGHSTSQVNGPVVAAPVAMPPAPAPGMPPGGMGAPQAAGTPGAAGYEARIAADEARVKQNPQDVQAWIRLGNDYFDTRQHQKSIDAYAKALALQPNNADVMTDQGIMYLEMGNHAQAAKNFERANQINPSHVQSLFNLGVVYSNHLNQPEKAIEAWTRVIQIAPMSSQAIQARAQLQQMQGAVPPK